MRPQPSRVGHLTLGPVAATMWIGVLAAITVTITPGTSPWTVGWSLTWLLLGLTAGYALSGSV